MKVPPEITQIQKLTQAKVDCLKMFIVFTGKHRDTKLLVERVNQFKTSNPSEFDEVINTISNVASELIELLQEPNLDKYAIWDYRY